MKPLTPTARLVLADLAGDFGFTVSVVSERSAVLIQANGCWPKSGWFHPATLRKLVEAGYLTPDYKVTEAGRAAIQ